MMSLPNNPLICKLFDQPLDVDLSREYKSLSGLFMEAHVKRLSELIDRLSEHTMESIDTLLINALRGYGSAKDISRGATTVHAWHVLLSPFGDQQEFFIDFERLRSMMRNDAESMHTYAVYITGAVNKDLWEELKALDPVMAADYFKYCGMFTYQNLGNPEVTRHAEFIEDSSANIHRKNQTSVVESDAPVEGD